MKNYEKDNFSKDDYVDAFNGIGIGSKKIRCPVFLSIIKTD